MNDSIVVELDRPRSLRLDMQALADLHKAFGVKHFNPSVVLARFQDGAEPDDFGVLLWALARHEDPELTVERANRILTLKLLPRFVIAFSELAKGDDDGGSVDAGGPPKESPPSP